MLIMSSLVLLVLGPSWCVYCRYYVVVDADWASTTPSFSLSDDDVPYEPESEVMLNYFAASWWDDGNFEAIILVIWSCQEAVVLSSFFYSSIVVVVFSTRGCLNSFENFIIMSSQFLLVELLAVQPDV